MGVGTRCGRQEPARPVGVPGMVLALTLAYWLAFAGIQVLTWVLVFLHRREVWSRRKEVLAAFLSLELLPAPAQWATFAPTCPSRD